MKTIHAHLQLSTNLEGHTRERSPNVVFMDVDHMITMIRTDTEQPHLPFHDGEVEQLVIHDDALSRSIDEEAWLHEFSRVIANAGTLRFTMPAEGALAWLDTMNAYRYLADISGRGRAPDSALPTGWNRHYTKHHLRWMLTQAGFSTPVINRLNYAAEEARMLSGMIRRNWIRQDPQAELTLFPKHGRRNPHGRALLATTWNVSARKIG